jgi:hypothetical protein
VDNPSIPLPSNLAPVDKDHQDESNEDKFSVSQWIKKVGEARKKEQRWRQRARQCVNIYRDDNSLNGDSSSNTRPYDADDTCFNILWANIETLIPALFSAIPNPDVRNRYLTDDMDAQQAGQVLERCLSYSLDAYGFPKVIKACIKDYLLTGRGVIRVSIWPEFEDKTSHDIDMDGNVTQSSTEVQVGNSVRCELVDWDLFFIEPAKRWEDVTYIGFENQLNEEEFERYFPDKPLPQTVKTQNDDTVTETKYQVYEIWDKNTKQVYFIGKGIEEPLKILDDPLKLMHFWPIPEPLYSIQTSDTLVPIPEYTIYQDLAEELNEISYRITDLVRSCKFVGIYDAQQQALSDILTGRDSQVFPVQSNLMRDGGMKSIMDMLDVSPIAKVLTQLYEQRDQVKGIIYEVTGVSDIIRGESKASETATAQNIKASYAGLRLRDRRDNINRFIVDLLRIKAELIVQFFTVDQLQEMSGIQITPQVYQILQSDILRSYKIDIESDSTILADMDQQAQKRAAIVQSITQFITATAPLVAQGAMPVDTAKALLKYALQPTKISRELEDALDKIGQPQPPQMMQQGPQGMLGGPPPQFQHGMPPTMPHPIPRLRHPMQAHGQPTMADANGSNNNFPPPDQGGNALRELLGQ